MRVFDTRLQSENYCQHKYGTQSAVVGKLKILLGKLQPEKLCCHVDSTASIVPSLKKSYPEVYDRIIAETRGHGVLLYGSTAIAFSILSALLFIISYFVNDELTSLSIKIFSAALLSGAIASFGTAIYCKCKSRRSLSSLINCNKCTEIV